MQAAVFNDKIMEAAAKFQTAHLDHFQPPPFHSVIQREFFQAQNSVGDALHLQIPLAAGAVVQEQNGDLPSGKVLLEGEHLAAVAQRCFGQEAHFGKGIEDEADRLGFFNFIQHHFCRAGQLDFGRMKKGVLRLLKQFAFNGGQFHHGDVLQRPSVRSGHFQQFFLGLGKRYIEAFFLAAHSFKEKLQGKSGLAHAWVSLNQIQPVPGKPSAHDIVQSFDSCAAPG